MNVREKGTGSVKKIKNKYYARWQVDGKDVYGKACDTRDEAELERINGRPGEQSVTIKKKDMPTLEVWASACMDQNNEEYGWYGRDLADSTYNTNETILSVNLRRSKLGRKKLNAIEDTDVEAWVRSIHKSVYAYKDGKRYLLTMEPASPSWKCRCHAFVSRILTLAIKAKFIKVNPAFRIDLPVIPERNNRVLTPTESATLYDETDRTGSLMIVGCDTGLRKSEVIRIMWKDIKPEGLYVVNHKNNKTRDLIPLTTEAREALLRQPKRSLFVFTTESGRQLSPRNTTRDVKARLKKIGLPEETRLQDLRGSFLTNLILAGVDIKTTQKLARHASPTTTLKAYLRTTNETKTEAIELMQRKKGVNEGSREDSTSGSREQIS